MRPFGVALRRAARPGQRVAGRLGLTFAVLMIIAPAAQAAATLSATPAGQSPGGTVTLSGSGFTTPATVSFTFDGTAIGPSVMTDSTGAFSGVTITVPSSAAAGPHTLSATVSSVVAATTVFNADTVAVSPTTGVTDAALTVSGAGWPPGDEVQAQIGGSTVCQLQANGQGDISGTESNGCRVPPGLSPGSHSVTADDLTNQSGQATGLGFTVPTQPPVAAFFPTSGTFLAGSPVQFDGTPSTDADGTISSHSWSFGDGSTSTSAQPSHTYLQTGTFTVTLTVTDSLGDAATVSHQITVIAPPPVQKLILTPVAAPALVKSGPASTTRSGLVNLGQREFCPGPGPRCTVTLIATSKGLAGSKRTLRVSRSVLTISPNGSSELTLRLSSRARAYLLRHRRLRVRVSITSKRGKQTAAKALNLTLVLPRR